MKIVYMGTPEFSAAFLKHLLQGPHTVVAVATQPDRPAGRGRHLQPPPVKEVALQAGLPVLQPTSMRDPEFATQLAALHADVFVVVAFSILPKSVLATARLGAVNLHGSLLPRYRGAAPVQWAIAHGETHTGVTVFLLDEKMDHGPILEQKTIPIEPFDTTATVLEKMVPVGCNALDQALSKLSTEYQGIEQDHGKACPAPKLRKEDGKIDWLQSAQQIHNRIRAFTPWPGGFSELHGRLVYLRKTEVLETTTSLKPGQIQIDQGHFLVGTGQGVLSVLEIQVEGKKNLPIEDYLRGLQKNVPLHFMGAPE